MASLVHLSLVLACKFYWIDVLIVKIDITLINLSQTIPGQDLLIPVTFILLRWFSIQLWVLLVLCLYVGGWHLQLHGLELICLLLPGPARFWRRWWNGCGPTILQRSLHVYGHSWSVIWINIRKPQRPTSNFGWRLAISCYFYAAFLWFVIILPIVKCRSKLIMPHIRILLRPLSKSCGSLLPLLFLIVYFHTLSITIII